MILLLGWYNFDIRLVVHLRGFVKDNGRRIEEMLSQQNAVKVLGGFMSFDVTSCKVEYGPSPDLRFGCTLTVDLQRRILEVNQESQAIWKSHSDCR